ncbi:MAG: FAD-dependent oxidoreductase [Alphaproteobacteria bacterium]|nr:MAG: FAD-dependent oxidoreductase [Alphaproteobacteria bacterium]
MQNPELDWRAGDTPFSRRYRDPYYAPEDGLAESRHVYLAGTGLPERFRPGFVIAELGFGTGLNFLAAWASWEGAGVEGRLRYVGFEIAPLAAPDMARALSRWPELSPFTCRLLAAWPPRETVLRFDTAELELVIGDARQTLPGWQGQADAWFLDGFSPARNPEMWEAGLMTELARHTRPGGRFATFSAAGAVRRNLTAAGFAVQKRPGFGRKREMCCGMLA